MRRINLAFIVLLLGIVSGLAYAQTSGAASNLNCSSGLQNCIANEAAFNAWVPVIIIAVIAGIGIALIYYAIATLLGNSRLKAGALYELSQVLGTVVILVIIFAVFSFYNAGIYTGYTQLTTSVENICSPTVANQLSSSPINFMSSNIVGPTQTICTQIVDNGPGTSVTSNIDYGLASTYVIVANVTKQAGMSLNDLNVFENYYSTLEQVNPVESVCWPTTCASNPAGALASLSYNYWPFQFYGKIRTGTLFIASEAEISFFMGILEMMAIIVMLFGWPYMLAAGLILRASFLTRRAGGLIIAIVIVGMFLYPFLNMFEYASLTNSNSPVTAIGANVMQFNTNNAITLQGQAPCSSLCLSDTNPVVTYGTGTLNFYVFPRLDYILNYYGCWPIEGSLVLEELKIAASYSIPILGEALALKDLLGAFTGSLSFLGSGTSCTPSALLNSVLALSNFYGQTFVFMVMIPVLNVLMLLSAVKGLSSLLGGDTSLLGLGRLV